MSFLHGQFNRYTFILFLCLTLSFSFQEPDMQGVQISNSGQQVDACARTNGGVHIVL